MQHIVTGDPKDSAKFEMDHRITSNQTSVMLKAKHTLQSFEKLKRNYNAET